MTLKEANAKRLKASADLEALKKEWGTAKPSPDQQKRFDAIYDEWKGAYDEESRLFKMSEMEKDPLDGARDADLRHKMPPRSRRAKRSPEHFRYSQKKVFNWWLRNCALRGEMPRSVGELADANRWSPRAEEFRIGRATILRALKPKAQAAAMTAHALKRADMSKTAGLGLEFVPEDFLRTVFEARKQFSPVREVCTVVNTSGTGDLPIPVDDDVTNAAVIEGEVAAVAFDASNTDAVTLQSFKYRSAIRYSREFGEDSAIDVESWAANRLGIRMGRGQNAHFTMGNNTGQPAGYAWRAGQNANAIEGFAGATLTYPIVLGLMHKLDPAYRSDPSCWLSMHDTILRILRSVVDTTGQPIFQENARVGAPSTIFGIRYFINQAMDSPAAGVTIDVNDLVMTYGAMSYHVIRDISRIYLETWKERYADTDQIAVCMRQRSDSDTATQNDWTTPPICVLKRTS